MLCAAASLAAQQGTSPTSLAPAPLALEAAGGGPGKMFETTGRQDPDYSLRGLFQQAHGDFMLKRERYDPMVELGGRFMPNAKIKGEDGQFDLTGFFGDIDLPFMVGPDGYVLLGAYGEQRRYQTDGLANFGDETVYGIGGKFGFGMFFGNDFLLEATVMPGVFSDLDGTLMHKDFDFPTKVLGTIRTADNFFLKLGVRYNEIYRDANILPYVGFSALLGDNFRIDLLAPEYFELSFWPSPAFGISLGTQVMGAQYRVRTSEAAGSTQADIQVQEIIAYGGLTWRFSDYVSLAGRAGMTVAGDYYLRDGSTGVGDRIREGTLEPALFAEITFGIDF